MKSSLLNMERFLHLTHADPIHFIPHRMSLLAVYLGSSRQLGSGWLIHQVTHAGSKDLRGMNSDQQQLAVCPKGRKNKDQEGMPPFLK